jgi:pyruvate,orthophosphate dikinase
MPGMMDTVLNLGLNDISVEAMAKATNNPRFAYDSYRRFIMMFGGIVIGISKKLFDKVLDKYKVEKGYKSDLDLNVEDLKFMVNKFKTIYKEAEGKEFPVDAKEQLYKAIGAVFRSWDN